jgi:hypothetical protein
MEFRKKPVLFQDVQGVATDFIRCSIGGFFNGR